MKAKLIIFAGLLLCFAACSSPLRNAQGTYRYKTTGTVILEEHYAGATPADTLVAVLDNESGSMELVSLHHDDSLLMTIDPLNGSVAVSRAELKDDRLYFEPYDRTIEVYTTKKTYDTVAIDLGFYALDTVFVIERNVYEAFDITVSGYAEVYDNNLVFRLDYAGQSKTTERTLRGKGITSLAKKN
jgi:hypothetical protein